MALCGGVVSDDVVWGWPFRRMATASHNNGIALRWRCMVTALCGDSVVWRWRLLRRRFMATALRGDAHTVGNEKTSHSCTLTPVSVVLKSAL